MQGEGQFRIVVGGSDGQIDGPLVDASHFLDSVSDPLIRDKVELIYRIFDSEPDSQTIAWAQNPATINDYENGG